MWVYGALIVSINITGPQNMRALLLQPAVFVGSLEDVLGCHRNGQRNLVKMRTAWFQRSLVLRV